MLVKRVFPPSVVFLAGSPSKALAAVELQVSSSRCLRELIRAEVLKQNPIEIARISLELLIETPIRAQGRGLRRASWPRARQASGPRQLWKTRMTVEVQKWARGT
jgi:hypothetical protein